MSDFLSVPAQLKLRPQWVTWKNVPRKKPKTNGKPDKLLFNPRTGEVADPTDSTTWSEYGTTASAYLGGGWAGIGFVFAEDDPYAGVDLDDCRDPDTGIIQPWAQTVIDIFASYTEISPSETGVKIFLRGRMPGDGSGRKCGPVEAYSRERFFTVTGRHLAGTPPSASSLSSARHRARQRSVQGHLRLRAAGPDATLCLGSSGSLPSGAPAAVPDGRRAARGLKPFLQAA